MDKNNESMVRIHKVPDEVQQALIEEALDAEGVTFNTIEPDSTEWTQASELYHSAEIWVLQEDAEKARRLIDEVLRNQE